MKRDLLLKEAQNLLFGFKGRTDTGVTLASIVQALELFRDMVNAREQLTEKPREVIKDQAKLERLRAALVTKIWEPMLRTDLVDRIVYLIAHGFVSFTEFEKYVEQAKKARDLFEKTDGLKGSSNMWGKLASVCRRFYEKNNLEWSPTNGPFEPMPAVLKQAEMKAREKARPVKFRPVDHEGNPIEYEV